MSAAAAMGIAAASASAQVIYSGVQNLNIASSTNGLYLNVVTGAYNTTGGGGTTVSGWDINPWSSTGLSFFSPSSPSGGAYARANTTTSGVSNLAPDTPIGPTTLWTSGGAQTTGTNPFVFNSAANIVGFRFRNENGGTVHYGWMRIQVSGALNAQPRTLVEWAFEATPNTPILAGDTGGPPPAYDPCSPINPTLQAGSNTVNMNQDTAGDLELSGCEGTAFKANYFKFVAADAGTYTFSTCTSGQATRMAVLSGCEAGSTQLACNDDGGDDCGSASRLEVSLVGGQTCYVVVGGESPSTTLPETIVVGVLPPPVLDCANAAVAQYGDNAISDTVNLGKTQFMYSNTAQTTQNPVASRQFFKFTPTATGAFTFKTCNAGDTKLAIATTCPLVGTVGNTIAFNDDAPGCLDPDSGLNYGSWIDATNNGAGNDTLFGGFWLTQELVAGTTYYIVVGGYSDTTWDGFLNIDGPQGSTCGRDIDGDGIVGGFDLAALLAAWGTSSPAADVDGDGIVGGFDLSSLLAAWGSNGC